jgi:hypothetical protein
MIAFFNDFDVYEVFKTATVLFAVIDTQRAEGRCAGAVLHRLPR